MYRQDNSKADLLTGISKGVIETPTQHNYYIYLYRHFLIIFLTCAHFFVVIIIYKFRCTDRMYLFNPASKAHSLKLISRGPTIEGDPGN